MSECPLSHSNKWKNLKFFYKQMTECFSEIFAQSQLDKERIKHINQPRYSIYRKFKTSFIRI